MKFTNEQIEYMKNASDHVDWLGGGRGYGKTHQLIDEMQNKINDLQSKIDKAIKYNKEVLTWTTNEPITDEIAYKNLEILEDKGKDK